MCLYLKLFFLSVTPFHVTTMLLQPVTMVTVSKMVHLPDAVYLLTCSYGMLRAVNLRTGDFLVICVSYMSIYAILPLLSCNGGAAFIHSSLVLLTCDPSILVNKFDNVIKI